MTHDGSIHLALLNDGSVLVREHSPIKSLEEAHFSFIRQAKPQLQELSHDNRTDHLRLVAGFIAMTIAVESQQHTLTPFKTALGLVSAATAYGFLVVCNAFLFAGRGWM